MINRTRVVNVRKEKADIYIGRPGPWGNPFVIGRDGTRKEVVIKFKQWIASQPALVAKARVELQGKTLGCFCKPELCHGDVLVSIANHGLSLLYLKAMATATRPADSSIKVSLADQILTEATEDITDPVVQARQELQERLASDPEFRAEFMNELMGGVA